MFMTSGQQSLSHRRGTPGLPDSLLCPVRERENLVSRPRETTRCLESLICVNYKYSELMILFVHSGALSSHFEKQEQGRSEVFRQFHGSPVHKRGRFAREGPKRWNAREKTSIRWNGQGWGKALSTFTYGRTKLVAFEIHIRRTYSETILIIEGAKFFHQEASWRTTINRTARVLAGVSPIEEHQWLIWGTDRLYLLKLLHRPKLRALNTSV